MNEEEVCEQSLNGKNAVVGHENGDNDRASVTVSTSVVIIVTIVMTLTVPAITAIIPGDQTLR